MKKDDVKKEPSLTKPVKPIDMKAFTKWCKELRVSSRTNREFTVIVGDHVKYVTLDRF